MMLDKITTPRFALPVNLDAEPYEQWINDLWFDCNQRSTWNMDIREVLAAQPMLRETVRESDMFLARLLSR